MIIPIIEGCQLGLWRPSGCQNLGPTHIQRLDERVSLSTLLRACGFACRRWRRTRPCCQQPRTCLRVTFRTYTLKAATFGRFPRWQLLCEYWNRLSWCSGLALLSRCTCRLSWTGSPSPYQRALSRCWTFGAFEKLTTLWQHHFYDLSRRQSLHYSYGGSGLAIEIQASPHSFLSRNPKTLLCGHCSPKQSTFDCL